MRNKRERARKKGVREKGAARSVALETKRSTCVQEREDQQEDFSHMRNSLPCMCEREGRERQKK